MKIGISIGKRNKMNEILKNASSISFCVTICLWIIAAPFLFLTGVFENKKKLLMGLFIGFFLTGIVSFLIGVLFIVLYAFSL